MPTNSSSVVVLDGHDGVLLVLREDALVDAEVPFVREQRFSRAQAVLLACFLVYRRVRNRILRRR